MFPLPAALLLASLCGSCGSTKPTPAAYTPPPPAPTVQRTPPPVETPKVVVETPSGPPTQPLSGDAEREEVESTLRYLASDSLEGRGVGTAGLDRAADFIAGRFQSLGLKPLTGDGVQGYFQPFNITTAVSVGKDSSLEFNGHSYTLGTDFTPLAFSGEATFSAPVVFAGYGIANASLNYDDYAGVDATGKIVVVMRFEPHDEQGRSRFKPESWSADATLTKKVSAAQEHGAAALVFVNPPTFHADEELMSFTNQQAGATDAMPVLHATPAVVNQLLKKANAPDLKTLQAKIDTSAKPASVALNGVTLSGRVNIDRTTTVVKNVIAVLPGIGPKANEFVVVGSHYDHLGHGQGMLSHHIRPAPATASTTQPGMASTSRPSNVATTFYGADDNASGTTAMLELARHFAAKGPQARSLIFTAFTAEELGVIGSAHFVNHPPVPIDRITAMLNMDMVGRLKGDALSVGGSGTAPSFDAFLARAQHDVGLDVKSVGKGGFGPSDHMSFATKKIPCLFLFTGLHVDYHRPTDTPDKINYPGMLRVIDFAADVTDSLLTMPREQYVDAADAIGSPLFGSSATAHVTLGVVPDYGEDLNTAGVKLAGTTPNSPAAQAGLKAGDVLTRFGDSPIKSLYDLTDALAKSQPGDHVKLKLVRDGKTFETEATLAARKAAAD